MSAITRDEVHRLAGLARIDLQPDELDRLVGQLDAIVDAVAKVAEVAAEDVPATSHPVPLTNVFRDDVVQPSLPVDEALAAAPAVAEQRFMVPQILGEEP